MKDLVHMSKFERTLLGGAEWGLKAPLWVVLQLSQGVAYARSGKVSNELVVGGLIVVPPNSEVNVLASVLGGANLRGCPIKVSSLSGFLTLAERLCLERDAAEGCAPFRRVEASHVLAESMGRFFQSEAVLNLPARLGFAYAFAEWLSPFLAKAGAKINDAEDQNPKSRLEQLINQMPESELTALSLGEIAKQMCCGERHASRLFHEVCGCSFRHYVSDLRLKKACQLLLHGRGKIIDVALESGHSSLALFNYSFKNRFRMTPTEWRERHLLKETRPTRLSPQAVML